ncbi:MAG TPA: UDP-N-acetylmuramoyl-L-alanyl-D-glutamate--2,6-diaminopimelate ligase [Kofleriaceae bacterium]|nr:UDP-N-acetylmuramoyl-L-alanyl-D-glutamate--2,6-diaminopimelate ligase [Kofleriaceae bacterium]
MTLGTLIDGLAGARLIGDPATPVRAVRSDSRTIEPGDVYVAVRGLRADGHAFVPAAIERGAAAVVVEHPVDTAVPVPQVIVPDGAVALGVLVGRTLGDPAHAMTLIGITGTNGKTTTTFLVEGILAAAGARPGVVGTVDYRWRDPSGAPRRAEAPYTTPTPQVLHETFAAMRADGTTHVVMEVSSFALSMARVAGLTFAVGAFSNLTQDHLDIHGSMAEYREAKRRLFSHHLAGPRGPAGTAVVNIDDPEGEAMAQAAPGRVLRVSADGRPVDHADIRVIEQRSTVRGIRARIATPRGELTVESRPLIGHYNVANLALAVGIGEALGLPHAAIARGIAELRGVPGRVERVANAADLDIFVDYAHTPDALRNVLTALRPLTRRRLICVFGCGGDRDPTKRPRMGAEVAELADLAVVTSDNPRTEDPRAIIEQILAGIARPFAVDSDRARAIRAAIGEAVPGDVVLIAGKGHEDYQIVGTAKHHFDDREQAAAAVAERERRPVGELARDAQGELTGDARTPIHRVVIDSRIAAPDDLYVAIRGESHDGHAFCRAAVDAGAAAVMVERSETGGGDPDGSAGGAGGKAPRGIEQAVDVDAPAITVADTRIALGALAREHRRRWPGRLVAITGSAGKTTTKELVRAALALAGPTHTADGSLNNETGVPLTVLGLRAFHAFGVVEMGMRGAGQIEYLTRIAEPDVAVVLNAGTAHIELLGSTDAIAAAKAEIWLGLRAGGTIVRPAGDDRLAAWATRHRPDALQLTFGERDADIELVGYRATDEGSDLEISVAGRRHRLRLGLVGKHAALDACAALAAAIAAAHQVRTDGYSVSGVTELIAVIDRLIRGLRHARPAAMRGEIVEVAGRKLIVDCYNANPASMAAALRALAERAQGRAIAVIGDMLELGDHGPAAHREIGELARELRVGVVALGPLAAVAAECAGGETAAAPADAAARALARTCAGDWILLKASRGMRLERVLDELRAIAGRPGEPT